MKKLLFAAAIVAASCQAQVADNQCQVSIDLRSNPDSVLIYISNGEGNDYTCDTVRSIDGKLTYTATIGEACMGAVVPFDKSTQYTVYLLPGQSLTLTDSEDGSYHYSGSPVYKEIDRATSLTDSQQDALRGLRTEYQTRVAAGEDAQTVGAELETKWEAIAEEIAKLQADYISANPSSCGSIILLTRMDAEDFAKFDSIITDEAKNGLAAPFYAKAKAQYEREQARMAAKELVKEGAEAPDFTLEDINGGTLTLSSLRGKYVVLDFWGSWCGWCIKGMPEMKKYYEKYSGRLEILGIDCGDTVEKWRAAVEKHSLPWLHVRNGEGDADITSRYAIEGYPTKLILDPDGRIVRYIVGEAPDFYTALDELLK